MIRHIVLTKFRSDVSEDTILTIYSGLAELSETLPGSGGFPAVAVIALSNWSGAIGMVLR